MNPLGYLILSMYFLLKGITICVKLLGEVSVLDTIEFSYNKLVTEQKKKQKKRRGLVLYGFFYLSPSTH